jgi:DnaJ-class molecular chaperone
MGLFKFLFGQDTRSRAQRDQYRPSVIGKNLISPINDYGTCLSCEGSGSRTLDCRACSGSGTHTGQCRGCQGSGRFERPAQKCFTCDGTGKKFRMQRQWPLQRKLPKMQWCRAVHRDLQEMQWVWLVQVQAINQTGVGIMDGSWRPL